MGFTVFTGNDGTDIWNASVDLFNATHTLREGATNSAPISVVCDTQHKAPGGSPVIKVTQRCGGQTDENIVLGGAVGVYSSIIDVLPKLGVCEPEAPPPGKECSTPSTACTSARSLSPSCGNAKEYTFFLEGAPGTNIWQAAVDANDARACVCKAMGAQALPSVVLKCSTAATTSRASVVALASKEVLCCGQDILDLQAKLQKEFPVTQS